MKATLHRDLAGAVIASLLLLAVPASAQLSPAQLKAQKDRKAQAAAAATHAAAAARAQEAAKARQRILKAAADQRERSRKAVLYAKARNQAVVNGEINAGYMIGVWAFAEPSICRPNEDSDFRTHFSDNGRYSGYEDGGTWSVKEGSLIWDYTDMDDNKIHQEDKVTSLSLNSFVTEVRGGHEIWFRCGDSAALIPNAIIPRSLFPEPSYASYNGQWELASEIGKSWDLGKFLEAHQAIEKFLTVYPKTTRSTSEVRNYAGLFQWKQAGNLPRAAERFLQNYQEDPAGERAADSLLSLAQVRLEMGDVTGYCSSVKQFTANYPFDANYRLAPRFSVVAKLATCPG